MLPQNDGNYSNRDALRSMGGFPARIVVGVLVALAIVGAVIVLPMNNFYQLHSRVVTVTRVDRGANIGTSRVYTKGTGTFTVKDAHNLLIGRWRTNSADLFGCIEQGKTYKITYYGWRAGLWSKFPNIWKVYNYPPNPDHPEACD